MESDSRDVAALFARYLDLWTRDETLGFEGIFLAVLNWSAPIDEVAQAHELFGRDAIPLLRTA